jgi:hypothetical protein
VPLACTISQLNPAGLNLYESAFHQIKKKKNNDMKSGK